MRITSLCPAKGLLLGSAILLLTPSTLWGHAYLLSTNPRANTALPHPPKVLELRFDSPIVRELSTVSLFDGQGKQVAGPGAVPADDPRLLRLPLPDLPPGSYLANWKVVSPTDGHLIKGTFSFTIGPATGAPGAPPGDPAIRGAQVGPLALAEATLHGLNLLLIMGVIGGGVILLLTLHPLLPPSTRGRIGRPLGPALMAGAGFTAVGLGLKTLLVTEAPLAQLLAAGTSVLQTPYGLATGVRVGVLLALGLLLHRWGEWLFGRWPGRLILLGLSVAAIGTLTAASHIAAESTTLAPLMNYGLHLTAVALWAGGVVTLAFLAPSLLRHEAPEAAVGILHQALRRFSPLALAAVLLLITTGLLNARWQVASPQTLTSTPYGFVLLVKLAFALSMLLLGALNSYSLWAPLLRKPRGRPPALGSPHGGLSLLPLRAEALCAIPILLAAALLTRLPPPRLISEGPTAPPIPSPIQLGPVLSLLRLTQPVGEAQITLAVHLAQPTMGAGLRGGQWDTQREVEVLLTNRQGRPLLDVTRVILKAKPEGADVEGWVKLASPIAPGRFQEILEFFLPGIWRVQVTFKRRGEEYQTALFRIAVPQGGIGAGAAPPVVVTVAPEPDPPWIGANAVLLTLTQLDGTPLASVRPALQVGTHFEASAAIPLRATTDATGRAGASVFFDRPGLWGLSVRLDRDEEILEWRFLLRVAGFREIEEGGKIIYRGRGTLRKILPGERAIHVEHEELPGLMEDRMTMLFFVESLELLRGFQVGEYVRFYLQETPAALLVVKLEKIQSP